MRSTRILFKLKINRFLAQEQNSSHWHSPKRSSIWPTAYLIIIIDELNDHRLREIFPTFLWTKLGSMQYLRSVFNIPTQCTSFKAPMFTRFDENSIDYVTSRRASASHSNIISFSFALAITSLHLSSYILERRCIYTHQINRFEFDVMQCSMAAVEKKKKTFVRSNCVLG